MNLQGKSLNLRVEPESEECEGHRWGFSPAATGATFRVDECGG